MDECTQVMFDYAKWRDWLKDQAVGLQSDGVTTNIRTSPDDHRKPSAGLEPVRLCGIGSVCWSTGDVDYTAQTFQALKSRSNEMAASGRGVLLTDKRFQNHFDEFLTAFEQANATAYRQG